MITVHLIRHGRVASHQGDVALSEEGYGEVAEAGARLAGLAGGDDTVHFLTTSTLRSRQTAARLRSAVVEALGHRDDAAAATADHRPRVLEPREEWAIRNPDLFLAGSRVEMVSTADALARQIPEGGPEAEEVDRIPFFHAFFRSRDRIGYWLDHPGPPGENAAAVGRRVFSYSASLVDAPEKSAHRYVCITHSPVLRAVIHHYLGFDPGEPEWVEGIDLTVDSAAVTVRFRERSVRVARPSG